jgi:hypothetical protein
MILKCLGIILLGEMAGKRTAPPTGLFAGEVGNGGTALLALTFLTYFPQDASSPTGPIDRLPGVNDLSSRRTILGSCRPATTRPIFRNRIGAWK